MASGRAAGVHRLPPVRVFVAWVRGKDYVKLFGDRLEPRRQQVPVM